MRARLHILLLLLPLLAGCGKERPGIEQSGMPIVAAVGGPSFGLIGEERTKAELAINSFDELEMKGLGLYAAYLPLTAADQNWPGDAVDSPQIFFENRAFEPDDNSGIQIHSSGVDVVPWRGNPDAFWPPLGHLSFFAYAPYVAEQSDSLRISWTPRDTTLANRYPTLHYIPDPQPQRQVDLMTALYLDPTRQAVSTVSGEEGMIDLDLKHQLTWVDFSARVNCADAARKTALDALAAKFNKEGYTVKVGIASVVLENILSENSGRFDKTEGFVWNAGDAAKKTARYVLSQDDETLHSVAEVNLPIAVNGADDYQRFVMGALNTDARRDGILFLLPHTLSADAKLIVEYGFFREQTSAPENEELKVEMVLLYQTTFNIGSIGSKVWAPGKHITYRMSLDLYEVSACSLTATVTPWTNASTYTHHGYLE